MFGPAEGMQLLLRRQRRLLLRWQLDIGKICQPPPGDRPHAHSIDMHPSHAHHGHWNGGHNHIIQQSQLTMLHLLLLPMLPSLLLSLLPSLLLLGSKER